MKRKKYLLKNTALFALNSIGTRIITFLLVPLYTITFTTSQYGNIDLITTISTIFIPIITLNIGEAVMRFSLDDDANRDSIDSIGIIIAAISILLGSLVFIALLLFPQVHINPFTVYLYCVIQGIYQITSCNLRGKEKLLQFAIGNIMVTLLSATLNILFLVVLKYGVEGYFWAYNISYFVGSIYCILKSDIQFSTFSFRVDKNLLKQMIKYSIVLVPNSFMWWIMNSSDRLMVISMVGAAANGIYAVSYKLPSILSALASVFNQAWSYSAIHEDKSDDRESFNNLMFDKMVRFQLIVTVFLMTIMKLFMKIYVEKSYYEAWKYTPYLLIGYFFLTLSTFLSTSYIVNKDSKGFLYSGIMGASINLLFNWILIPRIGVHGAALATCISYFCVFLYRYNDTKKYINIFALKKDYILGYLLLIMTGISMFINGIFGGVVLCIELIIVCVMNRSIIFDCFFMIQKMCKSLINRK